MKFVRQLEIYIMSGYLRMLRILLMCKLYWDDSIVVTWKEKGVPLQTNGVGKNE